MAMHKIVNGIKIDLSPEEEERVLAEWESNRQKNEILKSQREAENEKRKQNYDSAVKKLINLGLNTDEINAFLKGIG